MKKIMLVKAEKLDVNNKIPEVYIDVLDKLSKHYKKELIKNGVYDVVVLPVPRGVSIEMGYADDEKFLEVVSVTKEVVDKLID